MSPDIRRRRHAVLDRPVIVLAVMLVVTVASRLLPAMAEESGPHHGQEARVVRDPVLANGGVAPMEYVIGQSVFERIWVSDASPSEKADGLGPLFNARSCAGCHPGGSRGSAFFPDGQASPSLLVRLGLGGGAAGDPVYGHQLQTVAGAGLVAEGKLDVSFEYSEVALGDGTVVQLRRPRVHLSRLGYGAIAQRVLTGLRLGPAINGIGPLGQVPVAMMLASADPLDRDKDGISGRVNWLDERGEVAGRFGWKAAQPDLGSQNAHAFMADLGLSTALFPGAAGECSSAQVACRSAAAGAQDSAAGAGLEVSPALMRVLDRFVAEAVLPHADESVAGTGGIDRGKAVFMTAGCGSCHRPAYDVTWPADSGQQRHIAPYTDLLLHDMGAGLADGIVEGNATGGEWRTAPLWGLHWAVGNNGSASLLHDGRARSIIEAIMWHGGEAAAARNHIGALPAADRDALMSFLSNL